MAKDGSGLHYILKNLACIFQILKRHLEAIPKNELSVWMTFPAKKRLISFSTFQGMFRHEYRSLSSISVKLSMEKNKTSTQEHF